MLQATFQAGESPTPSRLRAAAEGGAAGGSTSHRARAASQSVCRVASLSLGRTRAQLLELALRKPHRIVPAAFAHAFDEGTSAACRHAAIGRLSRLLFSKAGPFRAQVPAPSRPTSSSHILPLTSYL